MRKNQVKMQEVEWDTCMDEWKERFPLPPDEAAKLVPKKPPPPKRSTVRLPEVSNKTDAHRRWKTSIGRFLFADAIDALVKSDDLKIKYTFKANTGPGRTIDRLKKNLAKRKQAICS